MAMRRGFRVLVIDEDPGIRMLFRRILTEAGYRVWDNKPSQSALRDITEQAFDLLIIDIDSLVNDGLEVIRTLRQISSVPMLALSARPGEEVAAAALDNGADDYVQKPFSAKGILTRLQYTLHRRARGHGKFVKIVVDELEIDLLHHRIFLQGHEVRLPDKPYEVLSVLAENAGGVISHREILHTVWKTDHVDRRKYVSDAIHVLRRKLEPDPDHPRYIVTEKGIGYRLAVPNQPASIVRAKPPQGIPG
jgi:two-component system, OmpR family, KDP operon response regulator KdpE